MIAVQAKIDKLKSRREIIEKKIVNIIDQDLTLSAKRLAFYLMENTLPKSTSNNAWPIEPMKDRIANDIRMAFPTVGDLENDWISRAYMLIEDTKDKKAANRFYQKAVHLQGKTADDYNERTGELRRNVKLADSPEEEFAKIRNLPRKIDDKGYSDMLKSKAIIRNKARQLPANTRPMAIVRPGAASSYTRKRQATAGLAKSAWWAAARTLGGATNYARSQFEEGRFVWPSATSRLGSRYPGLGSSSKSVTINGGRIVLKNNLSYAENAIFGGGIENATRRAQEAMRILFEKRMRAKETWNNRRAA